VKNLNLFSVQFEFELFKVPFCKINNFPLHLEEKFYLKKKAWHQWLTPIILATQEAEIWRIPVQSQPGQIVHKSLSQKHPSQKGLVEWLKVKALSSSSSTKNNKKMIEPICKGL
jgi:hypothetical protein